MIHAVFRIYPCKCKAQCYKQAKERVGYTGHGRAWQNVFANLKRAGPELLGRDVGSSSTAESHLVKEIFERVQNDNIPLTPRRIARWTPEVANWLEIKKYRVVCIWGLSLELVGSLFLAR
jgi:hypothetical protein